MDVSFGEEPDDDDYDDVQHRAREQEGFSEKECIIFLLDAREPMLNSSSSGKQDSPFAQALASIADCIRDRIINADGDLVGVILFGTQHSKVPAGMQAFPNTYILLEPGLPSATAIRQLQSLQKSEDYSEFGHISSSDVFELNNVLWLVAMLLSSSPQARKCRQRVLLVTSDDAPCPSAEARRRALLRAKDLHDARVQLEPIFLSSREHSFDVSPSSFWYELLSEVRANYPSAGLEADGEGRIESMDEWASSCVCEDKGALFARIRRTQHRKSSYGALDLRVSADILVSLKMVSYIRTFVKPPPKKHHAASNEPLSSERTQICNQHGSVLQPSDLWKGWDFGGSWVYFEPYELRQIRDGLGKTGLTLLGFKPVDRLKLYHNLRTPVFLEPADARPGSICAAQALAQAMSNKKKVAICSFRRNSALKLVALLPQLQELDKETRTVHLPTGFHMLQLPWADEVRSPELAPPLALKDFSEQQLDATRALVRELKLPKGEPTMVKVCNPAAHRYFAIMQAVVLGTEQVEETVDASVPDAAWLDEQSSCVEQFLDAFEVAPASEPTARGGEERASKRTKMSPPETHSEWLSLFTRTGKDGLSGLTNGVLKDFCKKSNLPQTGRKDELVARVGAKLEELLKDEHPRLCLTNDRQDE